MACGVEIASISCFAPPPRLVSDADEIPVEIVRVIGQRGILDAEFDAVGAGETSARCRLSRPATSCRGDDSCDGLEEAATGVIHVLVS